MPGPASPSVWIVRMLPWPAVVLVINLPGTSGSTDPPSLITTPSSVVKPSPLAVNLMSTSSMSAWAVPVRAAPKTIISVKAIRCITLPHFVLAAPISTKHARTASIVRPKLGSQRTAISKKGNSILAIKICERCPRTASHLIVISIWMLCKISCRLFSPPSLFFLTKYP